MKHFPMCPGWQCNSQSSGDALVLIQNAPHCKGRRVATSPTRGDRPEHPAAHVRPAPSAASLPRLSRCHPDPAERLTLGNVPGVPCPALLWRREAFEKRKRMRKGVGKACGKRQKHFADTSELRSKMVDLSRNTNTLAHVQGNS